MQQPPDLPCFLRSCVQAQASAQAPSAWCRFLLRDMVAGYMTQHWPKWSAVDTAVSKEGWKLITLLRLSPIIPWNVLNYALSVTGAPLLPRCHTPAGHICAGPPEHLHDEPGFRQVLQPRCKGAQCTSARLSTACCVQASALAPLPCPLRLQSCPGL